MPYIIDDRDALREITSIPQSDVGAPCPMLIINEGSLVIVFYVLDTAYDSMDGTAVKVLSPRSGQEACGVVVFHGVRQHMFGMPNDEAIHGHPLHDRGLRPYSYYQVLSSSWLRLLEGMNSVHEHHRPENFQRCRHYIFTFHDSTFECIADDFTFSIERGTVQTVLERVMQTHYH